MFWKANGNGTSTMIVDALIVTSRNFKSIFVYQRFHVPPCAPSVQTFETCKKRLLPLSPKGQVRYWFGLLPTLTGPNCLIAFRKTCIFWISNPQATQRQIFKFHTQEIKGGACRFGLKSRQNLAFKGTNLLNLWTHSAPVKPVPRRPCSIPGYCPAFGVDTPCSRSLESQFHGENFWYPWDGGPLAV